MNWFNFNMFGQFGMQEASQIPSLISSNTLTIDTLFSSDSSLMDLRFKSEMLGRYFSRNPNLFLSLLKLLVHPPTESDSKERQIRWPFMASELFSMDIPFFIESLFEYSPQEEVKQQEEDFAEPKMVESFEMPVEEIENQEKENKEEEDQKKQEKDNNNEILKGIDLENQQQDEQESKKEEKKEEQKEQQEEEESKEQQINEEPLKQNPLKNLNEKEEDNNNQINNNNNNSNQIKISSEEKQESEIKGIQLLEFLLQFLEIPRPLNYTSAGYFAKALAGILSKMPNQVKQIIINYYYDQFATYVFNNLKVCYNLIKHINMSAFSESIIKLIALDTSIFDNLTHSFLKERKIIIDILLMKFFISDDYEELENINYIFSELFSKQDSVNGKKEIFAIFLKKKYMTQLFWKIHQEAYQSESALTLLFTIFQTFCSKKTNTYDYLENNDQQQQETYLFEIDFQIGILTIIIEHFQELIKLLSLEKKKSKNQIGQENELFGKNKIKILQIVVFMIEFSVDEKSLENADLRDVLKGVYSIMDQTNILKICLDISKQFPWNNFAGILVEKIFKSVLESKNENLYEQLFNQANLIDYIIQELPISFININKELSSIITNGNRAFLIQLAIKINELRNSDKTDKKLKEILQSTDEKWKQLLDQNLQKIIDDQQKTLGGRDPRKPDYLLEENNETSSNIQDIFQRFNALFQANNFDTNFDNQDEQEDNDDLNDREKSGPLNYADLCNNSNELEQEEQYNSNQYWGTQIIKSKVSEEEMDEIV